MYSKEMNIVLRLRREKEIIWVRITRAYSKIRGKWLDDEGEHQPNQNNPKKL